jgi:ubiquinone/menaquinone biosynthesis C-methylase UbiE
MTFAFQFDTADVPAVYDRLLVPRLFEPWAELLLRLAAVKPGEMVLDVATGPGTVARAAAVHVGPTGLVTATDISAHMLRIARAKRPPGAAAPITYIESAAAPLFVPDGAFDLVTCQQGLQFFPDRLGALAELRRALRPAGRAAVAVWSAIGRCPVYAALHAALRDVVPAGLADELLAPFALSDAAELRRLFAAAGFDEVRVSERTLPLVFELGVEQAADTLAATPLQPRLSALDAARRAALAQVVRARLARLRTSADGAVRSSMAALVAMAR